MLVTAYNIGMIRSKTPTHTSRRQFLRLSLALPCLAVSVALPVDLFAQNLAASVGEASLVPGHKPRAPRLLMLDAGHGGYDPGAIGLSGIQEKEVTLDIVRHMVAAFGNEDMIKVQQTRSDDVFLPLPERVRLSRQSRADLFLSVHADSAPNSSAHGLSAYTLSEHASDNFARALAKQENRVEGMGGVDLGEADREVAEILMDLTTRRTQNTAQRAKVNFIKNMGTCWNLLENPVRAANFAVLRAPDVPSILVETGFLSNPHDEAILRQPKQRQRIAQLMAKEIANLLNSNLFG